MCVFDLLCLSDTLNFNAFNYIDGDFYSTVCFVGFEFDDFIWCFWFNTTITLSSDGLLLTYRAPFAEVIYVADCCVMVAGCKGLLYQRLLTLWSVTHHLPK